MPVKSFTGKQSSIQHYFNIDSLISTVKKNGWDNSSLIAYQRYIVNSKIDPLHGKKQVENLPGNFEKLFLISLIQKKQGDYSGMYNTLLSCLKYAPLYYPFYNELVFASSALNRNKDVEKQLNLIQNFPGPQLDYTSGLLNYSNGNYSSALSYLLEAGKQDSADFNILYQISYTYRNLGDYDKAYSAMQKALNKAGNDLWFKTRCIIAMGSLYYLSQKTGQAEKYFLDGYNTAAAINDKYDLANSLIDLGIVSDEKGNVDNARKNYKEAINLADEIRDTELKALALSELGVSYSFTNNLVEARQNYVASYGLYKITGNSLRLSLLADNIGKIFLNLFNYESAINYFQEGIKYAGDNKRSLALNLLGMADAYSNLSNYSKALEYYQQVNEISSQIKDISLSSDAFSGLGALNYNINNYNTALKYFYAAAGRDSSINPYSEADIYNKLGLTYFQIDSLSKAKDYFLKSIDIAAKVKDYKTLALSSGDLCKYYLDCARPDDARKYLTLAEQSADKDGSKYLKAINNILRGEYFFKAKDYSNSETAYKSAVAAGKELQEHDIQIEAVYSLAKLSLIQNRKALTDYYYNDAINLIDNISNNLHGNNNIQILYFSSLNDVYNSYIKYLLSEKRYNEAFNILEQSRSRNTTQNLANLKLEEEFGNQETLDRLYDYNWQITSGIYGKPQSDSIAILYASFKKLLITLHPDISKYLGFQKVYNLEEIQKNLSDGEYIISIYPSVNEVALFIISKYRFVPMEIDLPYKTLLDEIRALSPYYNPENKNRNLYNKDLFSFNTFNAYKLYNSILKNALDSIPANSNIIFSLPPEMLSVPLEFLVKSYNSKTSPFNYNNKDYLIGHYNISYTPSAGLYIEQKMNKLINNGKILLVGNPEIKNSSNSFAQRRGLLDDINDPARNIPLLPLKYSADEIDKISGIISADKILTGHNATETYFKQSAPLSEVIHLSTHSFITNKQPVIFFSSGTPADDGFLETGEIVKLKLNSDLVVLSSCNSGRGAVDPSEGVLGMTKAFFETGAKSVVVSLWEVDDRYTSDFMSLFYTKLNQGYDKSRALRYAKIEFIKKYSPNPYYWSAFVLSGNISPLMLKQKADSAPLITILLVIIGAAFLAVMLSKPKHHP